MFIEVVSVTLESMISTSWQVTDDALGKVDTNASSCEIFTVGDACGSVATGVDAIANE